MSNLKYLNLEQLRETKRQCERYIWHLGCKISGQKERLKWIESYIENLEEKEKNEKDT